MSPITRDDVKFAQRIKDLTKRNNTLRLIEVVAKSPDLAHYSIATIKWVGLANPLPLFEQSTYCITTNTLFKGPILLHWLRFFPLCGSSFSYTGTSKQQSIQCPPHFVWRELQLHVSYLVSWEGDRGLRWIGISWVCLLAYRGSCFIASIAMSIIKRESVL